MRRLLPSLTILLAIPLLAQNVTWTDVAGNTAPVYDPDYTLTKTSGGSDWNGGARSVQSIGSGDCYLTTKIAGPTGKVKAIGLTDNTSGNGYGYMDYCFLVLNDNTVRVYEGGSQKANIGAAIDGHILRIQVESGTVTYYNGPDGETLVYTSSRAVAYPLYADVALNYPWGVAKEVMLGQGTPGGTIGPTIASFVASDPDAADHDFGVADTLTVKFSENAYTGTAPTYTWDVFKCK